MEFISYLSLSGLAPATIHLHISGVRANLHWWGLNRFQDSFVIKMMLKDVSAKHREPDIQLPITRDLGTDVLGTSLHSWGSLFDSDVH